MKLMVVFLEMLIAGLALTVCAAPSTPSAGATFAGCAAHPDAGAAQRAWEAAGRPAPFDRDHDGRVCESARRWRRLASGSRVFTCSWSDWSDPWRDEAWDIIRQRPDLIWQVLTKRPERIADCLPADWGEGWPHVWLGVSIENRRWVQRAELLRRAPAGVRFVTAERLLGPLVLDGWTLVPEDGWPGSRYWADGWSANDGLDLTGINRLIIGGESGPRARRFDMAWAHALIAAARRHNTAVHVKQLGTRWARAHGGRGNGDDPSAWPAALRLREPPGTRAFEALAHTSHPTQLQGRRSA
jgi:protein gp37